MFPRVSPLLPSPLPLLSTVAHTHIIHDGIIKSIIHGHYQIQSGEITTIQTKIKATNHHP